MQDGMIIILVLFLVLASLPVLGVLLFKARSKNKLYYKKYSKIIDVDEAVEEAEKRKNNIDKDIFDLRESYSKKKEYFDALIKEVAIYDEEIELAELGFYKPHYSFDTSEKYKDKISQAKNKQKEMIKNKDAVYCTQQWTVEGSKAKGKTMTNRGIRLTARAFNNECDAAISRTNWNNAERMEQRISKAFEAINKLNQSNAIVISHGYLVLKLDELRLTHEYKEKKNNEKEEQSAIRQQMREEAKLEQEVEQAEKEEEKYQGLLEKAKLEVEKASGQNLEKLKEKMAQLERDLEVAHSKNERAKSMAQLTRAGHIYVISNVGSFGEGIYKIGMTRRLEPQDRVKELGDASVPFTFDVHAMIYSDDAPSLEKSLHAQFDQNRINLVNSRKEFFQVVLEDIQDEVQKISSDAEFYLTAEAREFRESNAIRAQREGAAASKDAISKLPDTI